MKRYVDGPEYDAGDKGSGTPYAKVARWAERFGTPQEALFYWRKAAGKFDMVGDKENLEWTWDVNNLDHLKAAYALKGIGRVDASSHAERACPTIIEALRHRPDWPIAWYMLGSHMQVDPNRTDGEVLRAY